MLTVELERLGDLRTRRVLDMGCGGGRHAFAIARAGGAVVALDAGRNEVESVAATLAAMLDEGELDSHVAHALMVRGDALCLPFSDAQFDAVIAAEVLEHIVDDKAALAELARVSSRGARVALSVPRALPEAINWLFSSRYHEVEGGHIRIYRRSVLRRLVRSAGFEIVGASYVHGLHSPYWWLRCLVGVENDDHRLVAAYHRVLVKQIVERPRALELVDRILSPMIGKSMVLYLVRR